MFGKKSLCRTRFKEPDARNGCGAPDYSFCRTRVPSKPPTKPQPRDKDREDATQQRTASPETPGDHRKTSRAEETPPPTPPAEGGVNPVDEAADWWIWTPDTGSEKAQDTSKAKSVASTVEETAACSEADTPTEGAWDFQSGDAVDGGVFRTGWLRYVNPYYYSAPVLTLTEADSIRSHSLSIAVPEKETKDVAILRTCSILKGYWQRVHAAHEYAQANYHVGDMPVSVLADLLTIVADKLHKVANVFVAKKETQAASQKSTLLPRKLTNPPTKWDELLADAVSTARQRIEVFNQICVKQEFGPQFRSGSILEVLSKLLHRGGLVAMSLLSSLITLGSVAYFGGIGALLAANPILAVVLLSLPANATRLVWEERLMVLSVQQIASSYEPDFSAAMQEPLPQQRRQNLLQVHENLVREICVAAFVKQDPGALPDASQPLHNDFVLPQ
eukprot:TRINITY_DN94323_c0_g1_i1.p1 TRINITY_DN94323_c0_g1~~TRINITY_DN94323_c0_g1_i1.p1  ORF type:complete len:446 (+),score=55.16 TRINITY_DN94323_c0_g1_i1:45-1382(+)